MVNAPIFTLSRQEVTHYRVSVNINFDTGKMTKAPKDNPAHGPDRYHHGNLHAALLEAAEAELQDKGVEGFSLRGIAKRVGVSHAAPAHHFGDASGLLTALAAEGFRRFLATQTAHQARAAPDPVSQLVASGIGYIDFAMTHPALFRLMFSSQRPDHDSADLARAVGAALDHLMRDVRRAHPPEGGEPDALMLDAMSIWALAHGLADLMQAGRFKALGGMAEDERMAVIERILRRSLA